MIKNLRKRVYIKKINKKRKKFFFTSMIAITIKLQKILFCRYN